MYYISICTDPHVYLYKHLYNCIFPISMLATYKFYLHVHLLFFYVTFTIFAKTQKTQSTLGFNSLLSILLAE